MNKITLIILLIMCVIVSNTGCTSNNIQTFAEEDVSSIEADDMLYPAYVMQDNSMKWGYINKEGKFIISPEFDWAYDFKDNNLAIIYKNEKMGLVDKTGKVVLEPKYDMIDGFYEGIATAADENKYFIINDKGENVFQSDGYVNAFSDGLAVTYKHVGDYNLLYGYVNPKGEMIIEQKYKQAGNFKNGKAIVRTQDERMQIIDKKGEVIAELDFDITGDFSEGLAVFRDKITNKYGYIDDLGDTVLEPIYTSAYAFEDGCAIVNTSEEDYLHFGVINKKGEFIINPEYSSITYLGNELFAVSKNENGYFPDVFMKKAVINREGKQICDYLYYDITSYDNGLLSVSDETSTYFINNKGERQNDLPMVKGIGVLELKGEIIKADVDSELMYFSKDGKIIWESDRTITLSNGAKVKAKKYRPDRCMLVFYPELEGLDDKVLQDSINKELRGIFVGDNPVSEKYEGNYEADIYEDYKIELNKDLLIVEKDGYIYPIGAAHGQPLMEYYYFNIKNGKSYAFADLFKKNSDYIKVISNIVGKQIEEQSKEEDSMLFPEFYAGINENQKFIIKKDVLQVYFYPYEIAAYAAGFQTFDISYNQIIDVIDTDGEFWNSFEK